MRGTSCGLTKKQAIGLGFGILLSLLFVAAVSRGYVTLTIQLEPSPREPTCPPGCGGYMCLQRLDKYRGYAGDGICSEVLWSQILPLNVEPVSTDLMTGPRKDPLERRPALIVIVCGEAGKDYVNKLITKFGPTKYRFMVMLYDTSDWSQMAWLSDVIIIRFPKQMKWWYIKRFVTPELVDSYEYVGIFDEDVGVQNFDIDGYLDVMRNYNIALSQPGIDPTSTRWTWPVTLQQNGTGVGRWVDFVECGPATFISREMYQKCVYGILREDLTSGWGIDLIWYKFCKEVAGFSRTAVIDQYSVYHDGNLRSTSSEPGRYKANVELDFYMGRMEKFKFRRSQTTTLGKITDADRVLPKKS